MRVGITFTPFGVRPGETLVGGSGDVATALQRIEDAGLDHVVVGDHVSFHGGHGSDGLIDAAVVLASHPRLSVHVRVYLLPLRHPILVARQLANLAQFAPGRLNFGVGVGGDDRHEVEIVGVDPATRGRRTDAALEALVPLLAGECVSAANEFFAFDEARILPSPDPRVPIVVGGRSSATMQRTARYADGWVGIWVSPKRVAAAAAEISAIAESEGRTDVEWDHGLLAWCGFGADVDEARARLGPALEGTYRTPFAKFERYAPAGTPSDVARALEPYAAAGVRHFDLVAVGASLDDAIAAVGEVRRLLAG